MNEQLIHKFAVKTAGVLLVRNNYFVMDGSAAEVLTQADLYVPKASSKNNGEDFAVKAHWVDTSEEAQSLVSTLKSRQQFNDIVQYNVIVVNQGEHLVISKELYEKLKFFSQSQTIEAADI